RKICAKSIGIINRDKLRWIVVNWVLLGLRVKSDQRVIEQIIECQWRIFFIDQQLVLVTSVDDAVTKSSFVQWHIVESKIRCCCIASQKDSHLPRTHPIVIESTVYEVVFSSVCSRETGLSGTSHHNILP